MDAYVNTNIADGIATIEFFHPAHNSLPSNNLKDLKIAIEEAGNNDDVLLIVLKSGGERTFCAGASFTELVAIDNFETGKQFFLGFANVINAIRTCGKIVIGRIQGKAVGGGVGVASACDYCFATKFASTRLSELAVGIGPFVIGPAVERKVGLSAFSQMSLSPNKWRDAEWCREKGLFHEVFESTSEMDEHIASLCDELSKMNPMAIADLKKVFWEGTDHWTALLDSRAAKSGELVLTKYAKEAITGFLSK
jgi:methylglutaconyl-CoA hydratase